MHLEKSWCIFFKKYYILLLHIVLGHSIFTSELKTKTNIMKAIINITNKNNQYSKFNGLTFEVGDLLRDGVGLIGVNQNFPNNQTDFNFSEVIIVDIEKEMQKAREDYDWYGGQKGTFFNNLKRYCSVKNLTIETQFIPAQ